MAWLRLAPDAVERGIWVIWAPQACQPELTAWICQSRLTGVDEGELTRRIHSTDPAVGLRAVGALRRLAEQVEATAVARARAQGWSWEQIGDALGLSRQSVHAKYRKAE